MLKRKVLVIICSCLIGLCMMLGLSSCGGKECAHVWANATCTTPKTCTLCNATEGEALGHTWVDATESEPKKCSVCGIIEGEALTPDDTPCTHEANIEKTIDLTSYNLCIDELHILSCQCGQAMELPYGDADDPILGGVADLMNCSWILLDEDGETDDNGNILNYHTNSICWDCDLEIYTTMTQGNSELQCQLVYNTKSTISIGGKDILKDVPCKVSVSSHDLAFGGDSDSVTYESIDLSEQSTCGGSYSIGTCTACGEVVPSWGSYFGALGTPFGCDLDDVQASNETQTDASGVAHTVLTIHCPDCGLKFVQDTYPESEDGCEISGTRKITVYNASNAVVYSDSWAIRVSGKHSYEYERKSLGDGTSCDVYYAERRVCETCGKKEYGYKTRGHALYDAELDLSAYSSCGGTFVYEACQFCDYKRLDSSWEGSILCEEIRNYFYSDGENEDLGDDGFLHSIIEKTCPDCGLIFKKDIWTVPDENCMGTTHIEVSVSNSNGVLICVADEIREEVHDFVTTSKLLGATCEDGVEVTVTCSKCGDLGEKYSGTEYHCNWVYETLNFGCGAEQHTCLYCGDADLYVHCNFELGESGSTEYDAYACANCGLEMHERVEKTISGTPCVHTDTHSCEYYVNGEKVYEHTYDRIYSGCQYEEKSAVVDDGVSCLNGVTITYECSDCHDTRIETFDAHIEVKCLYDLNCSIEGFCDDHSFYVGSCACGGLTSIYYDYMDLSSYSSGSCDLCNYRVICELIDDSWMIVLLNGADELYRYVEPIEMWGIVHDDEPDFSVEYPEELPEK